MVPGQFYGQDKNKNKNKRLEYRQGKRRKGDAHQLKLVKEVDHEPKHNVELGEHAREDARCLDAISLWIS